jgi:hypothetical protein
MGNAPQKQCSQFDSERSFWEKKMKFKSWGSFVLLLATIAIIFLIIFGSITTIQSYTSNISKPERTYIGEDVYRFVDEEAGVVCWTYRVWETLTCLPIKDTLLGH